MSFWEHLDELRARLMRCLWIFMIGFGVFFFNHKSIPFLEISLTDRVMAFLREPLFAVMPADKQSLYFTSLFENFFVHLKIAAYSTLFCFSPFFFYQLWAFIAPGLYPRERKYVVPFVSAATFFFLVGAGFAYFVLFPVGFKYFVQFGGPGETAMLTMDSYYSTCLKLMLLFGVAFELPVLLSLLGFLGVVDDRDLRTHRRSAIIGITVVSALFAPPDAVSMLILMAPLILMYEGSIYVVRFLGARRKRDIARRAAAERQAAHSSALVGRSDV